MVNKVFLKKRDIKIKKRRLDVRKGDCGRVLIIGGSRDYVGALALSGLAALRSGADVVTVVCPEKVGWALNELSSDLIVKKVRGDRFFLRHIRIVMRLVKENDAILIGNGLGEKSNSFVRKIVDSCVKLEKRIVIDADAIKAVLIQDLNSVLLTPHRREFEILLKNSKLLKSQLRRNLDNNVLLLKGVEDEIISKEKVRYNKTGNERMAVAGTGDVLAGLVVGFLAQGYSRFDSACYGAYINGELGGRLKKKKGYSYIASDLVRDFKRLF